MIKLENMESNVERVTVPQTLTAGDFATAEPRIDALIRDNGKIRLLVDASGFEGWENMAAFEKHVAFVKAHQHNVERIAVIAGKPWQHWVAGALGMFVEPEIRIYDQKESPEAKAWVMH